jgi:hypothetical protein
MTFVPGYLKLLMLVDNYLITVGTCIYCIGLLGEFNVNIEENGYGYILVADIN